MGHLKYRILFHSQMLQHNKILRMSCKYSSRGFKKMSNMFSMICHQCIKSCLRLLYHWKINMSVQKIKKKSNIYINCMSILKNSDIDGRKLYENENISVVFATPKSKYHCNRFHDSLCP